VFLQFFEPLDVSPLTLNIRYHRNPHVFESDAESNDSRQYTDIWGPIVYASVNLGWRSNDRPSSTRYLEVQYVMGLSPC
jgi:hypothetical protein